jgi:hypothetical protein
MTRWEYLIDNLVKVGANEIFDDYGSKEGSVIHCTHLACFECPYSTCGPSISDCTEERAKDYPLIIANIYENRPELLV